MGPGHTLKVSKGKESRGASWCLDSLGSRWCAFQRTLPTMGGQQAWGGGVGVWTCFVLEAMGGPVWGPALAEPRRGADTAPMLGPQSSGAAWS